MKKYLSDIDLNNDEFQKAYRLLKETNANVFLTGKAGTGKSTFLRYICSNLSKQFVILAPTGVAAVNVGGVTIHSFFQMPLRPVPPDDPDYSVLSFKRGKLFSRSKLKLLRQLELIIIDEVSMVRPDMIDYIDRLLRGVRRSNRPFGGVQLLLVGDIFQLEPVINNDTKLILTNYYTDFFFFNAKAYQNSKLVSIELKKIYRQSDSNFIKLLDRIRLNNVTQEDLKILNQSYVSKNPSDEDMFNITLTSRRDIASRVNKEKMECLPGKEYVFNGMIQDDFPEKQLPTDLNLILKKEAQVMMIRNDKDKRWVNGTLAKVIDLDEETITVKLENGKEEKVEREEWTNITYSFDEKEKRIKEEVLGRFIQFPIKAAWALTIHKSQGLTFNNVSIDMGVGAFSAGQTYVALSRCRNLEGIRMISPIRYRDVIVSRGANQFSHYYNDEGLIDTVFRTAECERLSIKALQEFEYGNFKEVVEDVWKSHELSDVLKNSSVRRLIAKKLAKINEIQKELSIARKKMIETSKEFSGLGFSAMNEKGDHRLAIEYFDKALALDKTNYKANLGKAECLAQNNDIESALEILNSLSKCDRETAYEALMLKGNLYEKKNDASRAALSYLAAHKKNKKLKQPLLHL
ncbi:MAG: AAA family ATPase, partial [Muribaculaceae bacterium]|nr:AAA family ATPase [Muribaculaceae bacterium]